MIFEAEILGILLRGLGGENNTEIFVQNEYTQCLLLYVVNIVITAQSAQYNKLCEILLDCEPPAKIVY